MKTIFFYDGMDFDGRGSRAVANGTIRDNITFIPLNRDLICTNERLIATITGDTEIKELGYIEILEKSLEDVSQVFFADLAPRTEQDMANTIVTISQCSTETCRTIIIDHHKLDYRPEVYGADYYHSTNKSACLLTWEYFNASIEPPQVVKYINDRDIWANKLQPQTDYFNATFSMMNDIELLELMDYNNEDDLRAWLEVGKIRTEKTNKIEIENELKNMRFGSIMGVDVAFTKDFLNFGILSNLGSEAVRVFNVDVYAHIYKKEKVWSYSLRSLDGQALKLIKDNGFKGGGHDNSCGFSHKELLIKEDIPLII